MRSVFTVDLSASSNNDYPSLNISQVGIVADVSQLLSQVRQGRQVVPAAQEVVSRRGQQPAAIHGFVPGRATNFN
jgi:hypothetical protein